MSEMEVELDFPFEPLQSESILEEPQQCGGNKEININAPSIKQTQSFSYDHSFVEAYEAKLIEEKRELKLKGQHQRCSQGEEPEININSLKDQYHVTDFKKYQKMFIKASKLPPHTCQTHFADPINEQKDRMESKKQRSSGESSGDEKCSSPNFLAEPTIIPKKLSIDSQDMSAILMVQTDSFIINSPGILDSDKKVEFEKVDAQEQEVSLKARKKTIKPMTVENQTALHENTLFQLKSQKKVTFIGDSEVLSQQQKGRQVQKPKKDSIVSIKDEPSMTSILNVSQKKRSKAQLSSRKIICQDQNYCLFRLIGFKKSDRHLMCRSVDIKDDSTEQKELKTYLISRENQHPNIVKMHSYEKIVKENSRYCIEIKMDFYPKNLEEYLLETKKMESQLSIERKIILFQILKGLNFIHSRKIYHRDLNPHSIMIGDGLDVAITNFAYIKDSNKDYSEDHFFQCNCYIRPPEVILQPLRFYEKGGDMWSFGCLAVYLLKGELPFMNTSDADMILQMIKHLGVPAKKYLEGINFKEYRKFIFPTMYRKSMKKVSIVFIQSFKCQDPELLQLLRNVFLYEAAKRATAGELMSFSYFDELRQEQTFKQMLGVYNIHNLFEFSEYELQPELKQKVVPEWY